MLGFISGKGGALVILGKTAYADVPAVLKPQVKELLEDSGLGELVTE